MIQSDRVAYRGRFAPSPTGPLHFGSLVAALASYADARSQGGLWFVRMEDLDQAREVSGAADCILRTLDAFGFEWDGPVLYQSTRTDAYSHALDQLQAQGITFPCTCSRQEIARQGRLGPEGPVYPGTCRTAIRAERSAHAIRLLANTPPITFEDRIQGWQVQNLVRDVGDFVLRRADGIHAYQLAVVVDDAFQGITQIVRGADLVLSTPRQIFLQGLLGLITPTYAHVPLAVDSRGRKLSKSDAAVPVDPRAPLAALLQAWEFLGQDDFAEHPANLQEFWGQALAHWDAELVPAQRSDMIARRRPFPVHLSR